MSKSHGLPRIAVWTPRLDVITGQNIVTRRVIEKQSNLIFHIFDYLGGGGISILAALWTAMRLWSTIFTQKYSTIYLVNSRSILGFLRDLLPLGLSRLGVRTVVHVHGSDFPDLLQRPLWGRLAKWLYRRCEIIVPSEHLLPKLEPVAFRKVVLCENFADINALSGVSAFRGKPTDHSKVFRVLWNSNVMSSKGIIELVEGLRLLRSEGVRLELVVLGSPIGDAERTEEEMRQFIASLNSETWVDMKGRVAAESVPDMVAECDAVALLSTYSSECQPLATIQAMVAGRIVVVADTDALHATAGSYPVVFIARDSRAVAEAFRPLCTCQLIRGQFFKNTAGAIPPKP